MVITCLLTGRLVGSIHLDFRFRRWKQLDHFSPASRNSAGQCEGVILRIVSNESDGSFNVCKAVSFDVVSPATSSLLFSNKTMCLVPLYEGCESVLADSVEYQEHYFASNRFVLANSCMKFYTAIRKPLY